VAGPKEVISKAEGTPCSPGDDTKESQELKSHSQTLYNNLSVAFVSIKQPISLPPPPSSANPKVINRPRLLSQADREKASN